MRMYARPARVVRITFREPAPHRRAHAATPGRETDGARPARPLLLASSLRASRVSSTHRARTHGLTGKRERRAIAAHAPLETADATANATAPLLSVSGPRSGALTGADRVCGSSMRISRLSARRRSRLCTDWARGRLSADRKARWRRVPYRSRSLSPYLVPSRGAPELQRIDPKLDQASLT